MAIEYKCENCAASLRFDAEKNMLVCDYCESEFAVDYVEEKSENNENGNRDICAGDEENWQESYDSASGSDTPKMQVKQRICPSCGGTLIGDEVTAATFCAFCGNATLTDAVMCDTRIPDSIIPFKLTKEAAQKAFVEWGGKGFITPGDFTSKSTVDKITGIYVPFYLYSCTSTCDYKAEGLKVYVKNFLGKKIEVTEHYNVIRNITDTYSNIPADASENMNDETMDLLEPFDFSELEDFKKAYMSGFYAEKYSFEDKEMADRIAQRVIEYSKESAADSITEYTRHIPKGSKTDIKWDKTKYCMLPVWILNYQYNGEVYEFAMNGQTGRVVGKRPISTMKSILLFALWFVPSFVVCTIIGLLFLGVFSPIFGLILGALIAVAALLTARNKQKTSMKAARMNYKCGETILNNKFDRFVKKTRRTLED